jgi:tetratricopeptide (TPR) repeat protein
MKKALLFPIMITMSLSNAHAQINDTDKFKWSNSERMVIANLNFVNGDIDTSKKKIIELAQNGYEKAQFTLVQMIEAGLLVEDDLPDNMNKNDLLKSSSDKGYLPAINFEILQIENKISDTNLLHKNDRWNYLIKKGAESLSPNLVRLYAQKQIYIDNVENQEQIIDLVKKTSEKYQNIELYNFLGNYYAFDNKNLEETKKWYLKSVDLGDASAANNLAFILAENKLNLKEAESLATFSVKKEPQFTNLDTLGWVYYKMKKYDKAEKFIKAANKMNSTDWELTYHLGMNYIKQKKFQLGIETLTKSLDFLYQIDDKDLVKENKRVILDSINEVKEIFKSPI